MARNISRETYDFVVVGSGLAGSILALCLSRAGGRTLVIEKGTHPRFAIGESTVPTTTLGMRQLGQQYGIPELAEISHYLGLKKHRLVGFPKRHFWFGLHEPGRELNRAQQLMFDTLRPPLGPDVHFLRSDVDAFLVSLFAKYGVDYVDRTELTGFDYATPHSTLTLHNDAGDHTVRARFIVDASGHASFFAKRFDLRQQPCPLQTNTRAMFGHFEGVHPLDDIVGDDHEFFHQRDGGTVHHCFEGGWMWVIPFDNGITSIGIILDTKHYPLDLDIPPEKEFQSVIDRFPTVQRHFADMRPVRPLVRTGRVQFTCTSILGDGFILTPHAAAFVDPLFSTGLLLTLSFIKRFVPLAQVALRDGDFSHTRFLPVQTTFFAEVDHIDRIVDGMIASFRDFELFRQYWRIWVHGSCCQLFSSTSTKFDEVIDWPILYGSGLSEWHDTVRRMHEVVTNTALPSAEASARLQQLADRIPAAFQPSRFERNTGKPVYLHTRMNLGYVIAWLKTFLAQPELRTQVRWGLFIPQLLDILGRSWSTMTFYGKYRWSKWRNTDFHHWVDGIFQSDARRLQTTQPATDAILPFVDDRVARESAQSDLPAAYGPHHGGAPDTLTKPDILVKKPEISPGTRPMHQDDPAISRHTAHRTLTGK